MTSLFHTYKKQLFSSVLLFGMFFVFSLCAPQIVSAQDATLGLAEVGETVNLGQIDLRTIIARIIQVVFGVLGTILLIIILYAGWLWMTSQGEEDKIVEAKNIIKNATIGLAIMLMAFSITTFIIRLLSDATGRTNSNLSGRTPPTWEDFSGSGSLGKIIADHYPFRDQRDVARNTKIIVTFKESIDPQTIIIDVPNDTAGEDETVLGVCNQMGATFDWKTDCDKVDTNAVRIYQSNDPDKIPVEAAAMASYEENGVKTFVFRPYEFLGSDSEVVSYTVELTDNIKKESGERAFASMVGAKYVWSFETNTVLDFTPPRVLETFPIDNEDIARNYIPQVTFDEPMDPTAVQGVWSLNRNSNFTNIIVQPTSSLFVTGTWKISNGYRTVEFIPSQECGLNACGDTMYCLEVDRSSGCSEGECAATPYQVLLRTATTISESSFESIPFSGVMDASGNALDSGADGVRDGKPAVTNIKNTRVIPLSERVPDNYFWQFQVLDQVDTTAPYVHQIRPSIDEENVQEQAELEIVFSRPMLSYSLQNIEVQESEIAKEDIPEGESAPQFWAVPRSLMMTVAGLDKVTQVKFLHRIFGPNNLDLYYYTVIPSTVKSSNQNCMYPGRGPKPEGAANQCFYTEENGVVVRSEGCIDVSKLDSDHDTGCGISDANASTTVSSTVACLAQMKELSE